ncbi:MAG: RluA family pseudouridine synthase [Oscillospiraceae bacterium]
MRELSMTVPPESSGRTVGGLLRERFGFAASLLSHLKFVPGAVLKNGAPTRLKDRAVAGDVLTVRLEEGGAAVSPPPLPVLYEDEDLLLLHKPAGMAVHGPAGGPDTVESVLAAWWDADRPFHPVNRLDKGTSGVMAVAKSRYIHDRLRRMLHTEDFCREYLALASGIVTPETGRIEAPLFWDAAGRRAVVSAVGKPSLTWYETVGRGGDCTLLRLRLATGRTHQIRAHCAFLGHPLLGDGQYGGGTEDIRRPALHSFRLALRHPVTGEWVRAEAALPEDMARLCREKGVQ